MGVYSLKTGFIKYISPKEGGHYERTAYSL